MKMGKFDKNIILLASALCLFSLLGLTYGAHFTVEGMVYCDTCRIQFITKISEPIEGAKVGMECRCMDNTLTYTAEAVTDKTGTYRIDVDGEHEEEICDISLVSSPDENCKEINNDYFLRKAATVALTTNNGVTSSTRNANPLGFMRKEELPQCADVLKQLGLTAAGVVP